MPWLTWDVRLAYELGRGNVCLFHGLKNWVFDGYMIFFFKFCVAVLPGYDSEVSEKFQNKMVKPDDSIKWLIVKKMKLKLVGMEKLA